MIKNHELFIEAFEDILFDLSKILFFKADTKRSSHYQKKKKKYLRQQYLNCFYHFIKKKRKRPGS